MLVFSQSEWTRMSLAIQAAGIFVLIFSLYKPGYDWRKNTLRESMEGIPYFHRYLLQVIFVGPVLSLLVVLPIKPDLSISFGGMFSAFASAHNVAVTVLELLVEIIPWIAFAIGMDVLVATWAAQIRKHESI